MLEKANNNKLTEKTSSHQTIDTAKMRIDGKAIVRGSLPQHFSTFDPSFGNSSPISYQNSMPSSSPYLK